MAGRHLLLVCLSLFLFSSGVKSLKGCSDLLLTLSLNDSLRAGDVIETFTNTIEVSNCAILKAVDKNLVLMNDTKNLCEPEKERCELKCDGNSIPVSWDIARQETYTLKFGSEHYHASVYEESPINTTFMIEPRVNYSIEECGTGKLTNAVSYFSLKGREKLFQIATQTKPDSIKVIGTVDYEQKREYELQLLYTVLHLQGEGNATVTVTVLDIDDQNPTFDHDMYQLNITENDSSIINKDLTINPPVHAYDQDFGINRTVIYSIIDQEPKSLFEINNVTGKISVTNLLDREERSSYIIIIKAIQTDKWYRSATATVIVNVDDIDDNIPAFVEKEYNVSINEHSTTGTIIAIVTATDKDEGVNAMFTYKLKSTSTVNIVAVDPNNGELTVADSSKFDRESFDKGIINIQVEIVPLNTSYPGDVANVTIHLIDINDNNPNFTENNYVFEAGKPGDILGQVVAMDRDEGPNANVTYRLIESTKTEELCTTGSTIFPFVIDTFTGNITVNSELFCERYSVIVEACDNPLLENTRRCSTAFLRVNHNSNGSTKNVSQTMAVLENSPNNTAVDVLRCTGSSYEIQNGYDDFIVDTTSGLILTNTSLDREETAFYFLTVDVSSKGQILCHVNITIEVSDLNDNPPVFQNVNEYVFNLQYTPEQEIGEVQANDSDVGQNAALRYSLQNKKEVFFINETNGKIYAIHSENLVIDIVRLAVEARDLGTPSLRAIEYIFILPKNQPPDLIPIMSTMTKKEIQERPGDLKSDLQTILRMEIEIKRIDSLESGAMLQLKVLNQTISRRTILAVIVENYDRIRSLFYTSEAKPVEDKNDNDKFGAAEIGLIVMAGVVLIGIILAIVVVRKQCSRAEKYQHLYESLTRNSSIYESQEIKVKMEDDISQLNGFVNNEEMSPDSEFVASATVNQAYQEDDTVEEGQTENEITPETSERLKSLNSSETSVEEAMESLDQLSDRLEQEDGENGPPAVYAHVDVSKKETNHSENASVNSLFLDENEGEFGANLPENVKQKTHHYINVPDNLAMKVMQAKANSPILARKHEDSDTEDGNDEDIEKDKAGDMDEPDPDYDNKQVRFSTEVLVADGIKVEPPSTSTNDDEADTKGDVVEDNTATQAAITRLSLEDINVDNNGRDPGDLMLEEEISSPLNVINDTEANDFFFGTDEETTHF